MDNVYAQFGDSNDAHIFHNGTDWYFRQDVTDGDIYFKSDDGSGGMTDYFSLDGGIVKNRAYKDINFEDNVKAALDFAQEKLGKRTDDFATESSQMMPVGMLNAFNENVPAGGMIRISCM